MPDHLHISDRLDQLRFDALRHIRRMTADTYDEPHPFLMRVIHDRIMRLVVGEIERCSGVVISPF